MVVDGLRRLEQEPDDVDQDLDEDEARTKNQLRLRGDERGTLRRPLRRVEDARYSEIERSSAKPIQNPDNRELIHSGHFGQ